MFDKFKAWVKERIKIPTKQDPRTYYIERPFTRDANKIPVGAVLLFSRVNTSFLRWAIQWFTNSEVCHAAVSMGSGEIVEAAPEGVIRCKIDKYLNKTDMIWVYDCVDATEIQRAQIKAAAFAMIGNPYDYAEIVGIVLGHTENTPGHNICSEVVGIAYEAAGLRASAVPCRKMTPGDIQKYNEDNPDRPLWAVQNVKP